MDELEKQKAREFEKKKLKGAFLVALIPFTSFMLYILSVYLNHKH